MRSSRWLSVLRLHAALRADWYRSMAALIRGGMPLETILQSMQTEFRRKNHALTPVVTELMLRLRGGGEREIPVLSARRRTVGLELSDLIPLQEAMLIDAGECAGDLGAGFEHAARYLASMRRLQSELWLPLKEPALLFALLLGVLAFFSMQVLPVFAGISPQQNWPKSARTFALLADHVLVLGCCLVLSMAAGAWMLHGLVRRWVGPWRDHLDRSIWPWTLVARIRSANMLVAISGFVGAGVSFDAAVTQLQANSDPYMEHNYRRLRDGLRNGLPPHEALCALPFLSASCHWMLRLYGQSREFGAALQWLAEEFTGLAIQQTRLFSSVLNFMLKLLVAAFVVWTLVAMYGVVGSVRKGHAMNSFLANPDPVSGVHTW